MCTWNRLTKVLETTMEMAALPEDIVGIICCAAARLREPNPCVDDIKTLAIFNDILRGYDAYYGEDEGIEWLANDLDEYLHESAWNYGVHRKWKMLSPEQRRDYFVVFV